MTANNSVEKKCRIRLMRSDIIKRASQDEQQNKTTIITNNKSKLIDPKLYVHFKKHNNFFFTKEDIGTLHDKAR